LHYSASDKYAQTQGIPNITVPPLLLKSLASVAAGTLSGLLAPGAVRLARCLVLATQPPPATRSFVSFGLLPSAAMQMAFVLPALGPLLWVPSSPFFSSHSITVSWPS